MPPERNERSANRLGFYSNVSRKQHLASLRPYLNPHRKKASRSYCEPQRAAGFTLSREPIELDSDQCAATADLEPTRSQFGLGRLFYGVCRIFDVESCTLFIE